MYTKHIKRFQVGSICSFGGRSIYHLQTLAAKKHSSAHHQCGSKGKGKLQGNLVKLFSGMISDETDIASGRYPSNHVATKNSCE